MEEKSNIVCGRNPVAEALRGNRTVEKIYVLRGPREGSIIKICAMARQKGIPVIEADRRKLESICRSDSHQGVVAFVTDFAYSSVEEILSSAKAEGETPFILVIDGITDPHNLGAVIRTANLAGAHGVIIPKRRAAGLTATVAKTSAGALNYTPVAKVTNLKKTMDDLKAKGLWFVCADMGGEQMYRLNLTGPIGLVVGSEGEGVSRLVKENCDFTAGIPMKGEIGSLNASVAAGVLAYEIVRQRLFWKP